MGTGFGLSIGRGKFNRGGGGCRGGKCARDIGDYAVVGEGPGRLVGGGGIYRGWGLRYSVGGAFAGGGGGVYAGEGLWRLFLRCGYGRV